MAFNRNTAAADYGLERILLEQPCVFWLSTTRARCVASSSTPSTEIGYSDYAEAANGREGVEKLAADSIDMIITDWNMPEMSGVDFIRAVRANDQTKHLPVIMVTTNAAQEDIVQALDAGVNNYVVKPFTPDTIRERIQSAING
ncbi:MAG: response regulator [Vicinamibacterales bacterium]